MLLTRWRATFADSAVVGGFLTKDIAITLLYGVLLPLPFVERIAVKPLLFFLSTLALLHPSHAEVESVVYRDGDTAWTVRLERRDDILTSDTVLNFPQVVPLDGDRLLMGYARGAHYGKGETRLVALSEDFGATWKNLSSSVPMANDFQNSGLIGFLFDGSWLYFNAMPREALPFRAAGGRERLAGRLFHDAAQFEDPTFRLRHFARDGSLIEETDARLHGIDWGKAYYELYGTIVELPDGGLVAPFQCLIGSVEKRSEPHPVFGPYRYPYTVVMARSEDGGRNWNVLHRFDNTTGLRGKYLGGRALPIGAEGLCEPDLVRLSNGDLLLVMRTDSQGSLYFARSSDDGRTWTKPAILGWPGVRPRMRLMSNGVLVISTGRGPFGTPVPDAPLVIGNPQSTFLLLSLDGTGRTWEAPFYFHTGTGCSYTSNFERDGKLHVFYSHSSFGTEPEKSGLPHQAIKRAVISIQRIKGE